MIRLIFNSSLNYLKFKIFPGFLSHRLIMGFIRLFIQQTLNSTSGQGRRAKQDLLLGLQSGGDRHMENLNGEKVLRRGSEPSAEAH